MSIAASSIRYILLLVLILSIGQTAIFVVTAYMEPEISGLEGDIATVNNAMFDYYESASSSVAHAAQLATTQLDVTLDVNREQREMFPAIIRTFSVVLNKFDFLGNMQALTDTDDKPIASPHLTQFKESFDEFEGLFKRYGLVSPAEFRAQGNKAFDFEAINRLAAGLDDSTLSAVVTSLISYLYRAELAALEIADHMAGINDYNMNALQQRYNVQRVLVGSIFVVQFLILAMFTFLEVRKGGDVSPKGGLNPIVLGVATCAFLGLSLGQVAIQMQIRASALTAKSNNSQEVIKITRGIVSELRQAEFALTEGWRRNALRLAGVFAGAAEPAKSSFYQAVSSNLVVASMFYLLDTSTNAIAIQLQPAPNSAPVVAKTEIPAVLENGINASGLTGEIFERHQSSLMAMSSALNTINKQFEPLAESILALDAKVSKASTIATFSLLIGGIVQSLGTLFSIFGIWREVGKSA